MITASERFGNTYRRHDHADAIAGHTSSNLQSTVPEIRAKAFVNEPMINSAIRLFVLSRFHQLETREIDAPDTTCGGFNCLFGNVGIDVRALFVFGNSLHKAVRTPIGSEADGGFVDLAFTEKPYPPGIG